MKKLIIFAIASFIGGTALPQETKTATAKLPQLKYGLKIGVNLPKYQFSDSDNETKTTTNFHVTGYVDAPISRSFSVQPGLSLQGKGGKFVDNDNLNIASEQNTLWIEIPVNLVGKLPLGIGGSSIFLGAGPYAAFGISGENKTTIGNSTIETDVDFGSDEDSDIRGTDFGVNFMGGVQLGQGFNIGAGYGLGLSDLSPTDNGNDKVTHRVLSFSVGYTF